MKYKRMRDRQTERHKYIDWQADRHTQRWQYIEGRGKGQIAMPGRDNVGAKGGRERECVCVHVERTRKHETLPVI